MIIFIDLGLQIGGYKTCAFFNTVSDKFLNINGYEVFQSFKELELNFYGDPYYEFRIGNRDKFWKKLISLIPKGYFDESVKI